MSCRALSVQLSALGFLAVMGGLGSCSDAHLYGVGLDDPSPDRLALSGRVCTEDAREAGFPVRVLFVADTALGPLFADFDPELVRLRALSEAVGLHSGQDFSFAVASFGPWARLLTEGGYTENPGELDSAIASLGVPQGCLDTICRDYEDALNLAASVVEGDLAVHTAGERVRTQYAVVLLAAGPPNPLSGTWEETGAELVTRVADLRDEVEEAGALSLSVHVLFLAAADPTDPDAPAELDATEAILQDLALAGAGYFERFDVADAISLEGLGLLKLSALLEAKNLVVTNASMLPGGLVDSDRDGIDDASEKDLGTDHLSADSDFDGVSDLVELLLSLNPLLGDVPEPCATLDSPWPDTDKDLLDDCEERLLGTDPSLPDTDGDGMPDWLEVAQRTDYLAPDLLEDADWDGAPNGDELLAHTDPGSSDAASHLSDAYRYEVTDEGFSTEPVVWNPRTLAGVETRAAGPDTPGGLGILRYTPGATPLLSWQSPGDDGPGPEVAVRVPGTYILDSSSVATQGTERWLSVDVEPAELPPWATEEQLLVELAERSCLSWTVRNIRLAETEPDGHNDVFVWFGEAPLGQLTRPGLFRLAHVPVSYDPITGRVPAAPVVEIRDEEFASIGQ